MVYLKPIKAYLMNRNSDDNKKGKKLSKKK